MCFNCTTYNLIFKKRKLKRFREPTISFILLLLSQICGGSDIGCQPLCEWGWRRRRRSAKWDIRSSNWVFTTEGVSLFGGSFIGDTHSPKIRVPFLPRHFLQLTLLLNSWCLLFGISSMQQRRHGFFTKDKRQKTKKRVWYCDVRAVSHSCDVFFSFLGCLAAFSLQGQGPPDLSHRMSSFSFSDLKFMF